MLGCTENAEYGVIVCVWEIMRNGRVGQESGCTWKSEMQHD